MEQSLLYKNQVLIKLTKNEILLMKLFISNKTKISSYEEILNILSLHTTEFLSIDSLMPIISRFRKKIPTTIDNIYGLGYRLNF